MIFFRISRQIPENSDVCPFSINFAKTNQKIVEISEIYENSKLFSTNYYIIQYYSIVSLAARRGFRRVAGGAGLARARGARGGEAGGRGGAAEAGGGARRGPAAHRRARGAGTKE